MDALIGAGFDIAYPIAGLGESLPPRFEEITLDHLLSLPVDTRIPFERFADSLGDGGHLFLGRSEAMHDPAGRFEAVDRAVYRKSG